MPPAVASAVLSGLITALGVFATFSPPGNRTSRMVLVAAVIIALIWLVTWESPTGLPPLVRGGLSVACMIAWYGALIRGRRLGLFALSPAENEVNEVLRSISSRAGTSGSAVDLVRRPPGLDALLRELDALDPPNERWNRVIRLTRAYLLALPAGRPVPAESMLEFLMWRSVWFDTYDRRILFAPRLDPSMEFSADLHLDHSAVLHALADGRTSDAASLIEHLASRVPPVDRWHEPQRLLVEALNARLASVVAGRDPERDTDVLAADRVYRTARRAAADEAGSDSGPRGR